MLKKKSSSAEKKRKHVPAEDKHESRKRRSTESAAEVIFLPDNGSILRENAHLLAPQESKDDLADPELDRIGSDIEEGGLDLSIQFQPITAYVSDKKEMLQQCFQVLGEKKLRKMLPDELKDCTLEEIQKVCWEQLEPIPETYLLQILTGEELTTSKETPEVTVESQQDNNVDSTSCLKDVPKNEEAKEVGVSSEESDVLSINADTYDSDIEAPKDEQTVKTTGNSNKGAPNEVSAVKPKPVCEPALLPRPKGPRKDIQSDIDRSVSEILSFSTARPAAPSVDKPQAAGPVHAAPPTGGVCQPSVQQLELLELEMRARAIKALMNASKKTTTD